MTSQKTAAKVVQFLNSPLSTHPHIGAAPSSTLSLHVFDVKFTFTFTLRGLKNKIERSERAPVGEKMLTRKRGKVKANSINSKIHP